MGDLDLSKIQRQLCADLQKFKKEGEKMSYCGVVLFNREKNGQCEYGYYINENILLDKEGHSVEQCWNLKFMPHKGCFQLPEINKIEKRILQ